MDNESWRDRAACRGVDTELFFPTAHDYDRIDRALRICNRCPVKAECATYAKEAKEQHGIWGGVSAYRRSRLGNRATRDRRTPLTAAERNQVINLIEAGWIDSHIGRELGIGPRTVHRIRATHTAQERATA